VVIKFSGVAWSPNRLFGMSGKEAVDFHVIIPAQNLPEQIGPSKTIVAEIECNDRDLQLSKYPEMSLNNWVNKLNNKKCNMS